MARKKTSLPMSQYGGELKLQYGQSKVLYVDAFENMNWSVECSFEKYTELVKNYPAVDIINTTVSVHEKLRSIESIDSIFKPSYGSYSVRRRLMLILESQFDAKMKSNNIGVQEDNVSNKGFFLIGVDGVGKKFLISHNLALLPKVITLKEGHLNIHSNDTDKPIQVSHSLVKAGCWITSITVTLFEGMSVCEIYCAVFQEIDRAVHTKYAVRYSKERRRSKFHAECNRVFQIYGVGVVVFEDCHKVVGNNEVLDFISKFSHRYRVPKIIITTPEYLSGGQTFQHFSDMTASTAIHVNRMTCCEGDFIAIGNKQPAIYETEFGGFLKTFFRFQWTKEHTELNPEIAEAFYRATAGIKDLCVKLFKNIQIKIVENEHYNSEMGEAYSTKGMTFPLSSKRQEKIDGEFVYAVADECLVP